MVNKDEYNIVVCSLHADQTTGVIFFTDFLLHAVRHVAPQHGDGIETIDYCVLTSPYLYLLVLSYQHVMGKLAIFRQSRRVKVLLRVANIIANKSSTSWRLVTRS